MSLVKCGYIKVDTVEHQRMTGKEHKTNGSIIGCMELKMEL
ncbi:Uncharacterised protein [Streptococcus pneumoniae]|nr:Uncharacterised protein [Streptococcus pneumoniae]